MKITRVEAFQVSWAPDDKPQQRSAFVRVHGDDGLSGIGEASPMQGGVASLGIIARDIAPVLMGQDPLDHAVLLDRALHTFVKLGPEGALTGALAALDIALWDIKGKAFGQPIYKLLGGAWQTSLPFYASIGGNGVRSVDEVCRVVEARLKDKPAAVKIRFDNDRTRLDGDIPGDIAKARAVRKLVGDGLPLSFQMPDGAPVAVQPEAQADLLTREADGFWRFAMALTLDRDAESFPKQQLAFFLRLKLHDGMWHVQLLDEGFQDFRIAIAQESERHALFDHMVGMVNRLLSAKPWDGIEKLPIGFELTHPDLSPDGEAPEPPLAQP